jgi:sulfite reductase (ferredoxin)
MSDDHKPSPTEIIKEESGFLRGEIGTELTDGLTHFGTTSQSLLKFHGTYQQFDRDDRAAAVEAGESKREKTFIFMVRTKIPGGKLTSDQLLAELDLCDEIGNTTLRITSRQGLQLHGVVKQNLKQAIKRINEIQLSTLGACGDVNRNVMCCPGPFKRPIYAQTQALADRFAAHFAPRSRAYHDLWLTDVITGEKQLASDPFEVEPIYGAHYLPRKFKIGIAFPFDNCIDVYTHDLGLLAIVQDEQVVGYNVSVGGGQGRTPSVAKTFPALGKRLCYAPAEEVFKVVESIVKVQRDFGNRSDRKVARLKYLVHDWGVEAIKAKVEEYYGGPLAEPDPTDVHGFDDHMGWSEQGDGRWFYGLNIENGRIKDTDVMQLKTALRVICRELKPGIRTTSHQSMLFTDIASENKNRLEQILRDHGVVLTSEISEVRRWSMACVAWPTCGLSITESERSLPGMLDQLEVELARLGLSREQFTLRMTGCPNGCARPYNCDVGLVGKARGKYTVLLGGRLLGDRMNYIYKDMVLEEEIVPLLTRVFTYFKLERLPGETLGDFCHRKGKDDILAYEEKLISQDTAPSTITRAAS